MMDPQISAPHFRHILAKTLEGYGKAPMSLDVTRIPPALVRFDWDNGRGPRHMIVSEMRVIDMGGPDWIAQLMLMPARKRRDELRKE